MNTLDSLEEKIENQKEELKHMVSFAIEKNLDLDIIMSKMTLLYDF